MMTTTTTTTMALVTRREDKRHVALGDATVAFFLALQEFSPITITIATKRCTFLHFRSVEPLLRRVSRGFLEK